MTKTVFAGMETIQDLTGGLSRFVRIAQPGGYDGPFPAVNGLKNSKIGLDGTLQCAYL